MLLLLYCHVASTIMFIIIIVGGSSVSSDENIEKQTRCLSPGFPCPVSVTTTSTTMATHTAYPQPPASSTTKPTTTSTSTTVTLSTTTPESTTVPECTEYWKFEYPADRLLFADDPDLETEVKFLLYDDSEKPNNYKNIIWGNLDSLKEIRLNGAPRLKIVIHGFGDTSMNKEFQLIKNNYLDVTKYEISNQPVLLVDWSSMAGGKCFLRLISCSDEYENVVEKNVPQVASHIRQLLSNLIDNKLLDSMKQIHLIGHNLGAQMSGLIGYEVQQYHKGEKVSRITGLDPAGPIYTNFQNNLADRLDESDADFVDVTHTSELEGYYYKRAGHADFFPNPGGLPDGYPGCDDLDEDDRYKNRYAVYFYAKSLYDKSVRGCPYKNSCKICNSSSECTSDVVYGEDISEKDSSHGQFCFRAGLPPVK